MSCCKAESYQMIQFVIGSLDLALMTDFKANCSSNSSWNNYINKSLWCSIENLNVFSIYWVLVSLSPLSPQTSLKSRTRCFHPQKFSFFHTAPFKQEISTGLKAALLAPTTTSPLRFFLIRMFDVINWISWSVSVWYATWLVDWITVEIWCCW